MESLTVVFKTVKKDVWMSIVDLKDTFFTVPAHIWHQKYFKFELFQNFYKFLGMPNGYSDVILKPVFGYLRNQGHISVISVICVDDSYLQGDTKHYTHRPGKSVLIPAQNIELLGFLIDSKNMKILLTNKKAEHLTLRSKNF